MSRRFAGWCIYLVILCGAFALPLREFIAYARHSEVHSYVLLIPFVTAYLIYLRWKSLSHELSSSLGFALLLAAAGIGGTKLRAWASSETTLVLPHRSNALKALCSCFLGRRVADLRQ